MSDDSPPRVAEDDEPPLSGATHSQINAARIALRWHGIHISETVLVEAIDAAMRAIPLYRHPGQEAK